MNSRVGLALGRDVGVPDDVANRVYAFEPPRQTRQCGILALRKGLEVIALQLDTDRKVVAALASAPSRDPGMPCAFAARNELYDPSVAAHQKMGRHFDALELFKIRVDRMIQRIGKKLANCLSAVFIGWEADVVNDQHADGNARRAGITVG